MKLLNIGYGSRSHKDWVNIDIAPVFSGIKKCNVIEEMPFSDESFDAVYHSHLPKKQEAIKT